MHNWIICISNDNSTLFSKYYIGDIKQKGDYMEFGDILVYGMVIIVIVILVLIVFSIVNPVIGKDAIVGEDSLQHKCSMDIKNGFKFIRENTGGIFDEGFCKYERIEYPEEMIIWYDYYNLHGWVER